WSTRRAETQRRKLSQPRAEVTAPKTHIRVRGRDCRTGRTHWRPVPGKMARGFCAGPHLVDRPPMRSQTPREFLGDRLRLGAVAARDQHASPHGVPAIVKLLCSERPVHVDGHTIKLRRVHWFATPESASGSPPSQLGPGRSAKSERRNGESSG